MSEKNYEFTKKFAKHLKLERIKKDMSQEELAFKAGISLVAYGAIESGKSSPKLETVYKIAQALDIEIFKLFIFND